MNKSIFLGCLLLLTVFSLNQLSGQNRQNYINKFKDIAKAEMERAGIPASIKLAQGILESGAGTSTLARKAHNHFGMKCGSQWDGRTYYLEDDDYDENGRLMKSCFRVFRNADASYIAHSEFLRDPRKAYRYGPLFRLNPRDYKAWAHGLKRAGYATSATYAEKLINIIETHQLFQYDTDMPEVPETPEIPAEEFTGIIHINNVKVVLAKANDRPIDIAERTRVPVKNILKFNEHLNSNTQNIQAKSRVYLQKKRGSYRGKKKFHFVKLGESMFSIAQEYGLRLDKLYKKNRLEIGTEPLVGEKVKIRGWKVKKEEVPRTNGQPPRDSELENGNNPDNGDFQFEPDDDLEMEDSDYDDEEVGFEDESLDDLINKRTGNEKKEELEEPVITTPEVESPPVDNDNPFEQPVEEETVAPLYHNVVKGETLYGISRQYNTSVFEIKQLNNLTSDIIAIGQRLRIR